MIPLAALLAGPSEAEPTRDTQEAPASSRLTPLPAPERPVIGSYDPRYSLAPLIEAVAPSVVILEVEAPPELPNAHLAQMLGAEPKMSEGTGFFLSREGLLLTNHHVIADSSRVTLVLHDGSRIGAKLVGGDPASDVALLQAEDQSRSYVPVELADSDALRLGDWVVVMGNGLGLGITSTVGIISGKNRTPQSDPYGRSYLQTDAAINLGDSGGPMFSLDGRVAGMTTAIIPHANQVGFVIPSNQIAPLIEDLRTRGAIARGFLGVRQQTLNPELRASLGVKAPRGALLTTVHEGTPAESAGLEIGDVILSVDGASIETGEALSRAIDQHKPGDKVTLTIERDTKQQQLSVVLGEQEAPAAETRPEDLLAALGLTLVTLPSDLAERRGVTGGVLVHGVTNGSVAHGRLKPGDVIVEVDRRVVSNAEDVRRVLARTEGTAFLAVLRGDIPQIVALPMP